MLTMNEDDETVLSAIRAGASGYLLKGSGADEVHNAIRAAAGRRDGLRGLAGRDAWRRTSPAAAPAARSRRAVPRPHRPRARRAGVLAAGPVQRRHRRRALRLQQDGPQHGLARSTPSSTPPAGARRSSRPGRRASGRVDRPRLWADVIRIGRYGSTSYDVAAVHRNASSPAGPRRGAILGGALTHRSRRRDRRRTGRCRLARPAIRHRSDPCRGSGPRTCATLATSGITVRVDDDRPTDETTATLERLPGGAAGLARRCIGSGGCRSGAVQDRPHPCLGPARGSRQTGSRARHPADAPVAPGRRRRPRTASGAAGSRRRACRAVGPL